MLERREWRLRTRFREVLVRVGRIDHGQRAPNEAAAPLADLWFELGAGNARVGRVVAEIYAALCGPTSRSFTLDRAFRATAHLDDVRRTFEIAIRNGELVVEEVKPPVVPLLADSDEEQAPESATEDEVETTFIIIETRDHDGKPIACPFRLELPNGEIREGHTGSSGIARVDGIVAGGQAKVTFPELHDDVIHPA